MSLGSTLWKKIIGNLYLHKMIKKKKALLKSILFNFLLKLIYFFLTLIKFILLKKTFCAYKSDNMFSFHYKQL
jgi:hypothetical protein